MSTAQVTTSGLSAFDLMALNRMHFPRKSGEVANKSVSLWSSAAALPFLAFGGFATNLALDYTVHIDAGHTNPVISLPSEDMADWISEEDGELGSFLSFLDAQMETHPEWIEPADEAQLDRLAKLLANVKA